MDEGPLRFGITADNLRLFCERQSLPVISAEDPDKLAVPHQILDRDAPLLFLIEGTVQMLTIAMLLPVVVPEGRMADVGQGLNLLNHHSYMGAWVLDPDAREVYFRVTLPTGDNVYTDQALHQCARVVVSSVEAVAHKIVEVIDGKPAAEILPMQIR